ncbi:MAG: hypothetical protein GC159_21105 [Phycisphaera sp.]|nr:hypothetical protein [Phycisphaera sp.]
MNRFIAMSLTAAVLTLVGCDATHYSTTLVEDDAWVKVISEGYAFTEGPAWDGKHHVYFSDIPNERIIKMDLNNGQEVVFNHESGKANGLMFHDGKLYGCEGGNRRVVRYNSDGSVKKVIAAYYGLDRLNSPNDLEVDSKGGVYFTDPRYGDRADMEMSVEGVYYVTPKGHVKRIISDLIRPNGVLLSRDGFTLYVADNAAKAIYKYKVMNDGSVGKGSIFAWMDPNAQGGPDGLSIDKQHNIYAAGQGHIWIWDAEGHPQGRIRLPENPSNVAFGGWKGRKLFVTAQKSLYMIDMDVAGGRINKLASR